MSITLLVIMFFVAVAAGFINVVSGGGGFLSISALLISGLPPANALATNKMQSLGSSLTSGIYFLRQGRIDLKNNKWVFIATFFGAATGTIFVQFIDPSFLKKLLPILIIGVTLYFIFSPDITKSKEKQRVSYFVFSFICGGGIGFYDGFLGAGAGTFYTISYMLLLGYRIDKAQIHSNFLNLASNTSSVIFFIAGGKMIWTLGLLMFVGQVIGARLGAGVVLSSGQKIIRPMIILVSAGISIKMLIDMYY